MTTVDGIPVKHWGQTIGQARIKEDGTIEMILESSQVLGLELMTAIERGLVDGLALSPLLTPAARPNLKREKY